MCILHLSRYLIVFNFRFAIESGALGGLCIVERDANFQRLASNKSIP